MLKPALSGSNALKGLQGSFGTQAPEGLRGPFTAFKVLRATKTRVPCMPLGVFGCLGSQGPYKALKGLIRPLRALKGH